MINGDIRTEKALEGKANYVIILRHFKSLITICYHWNFLGSTPAASTIIFQSFQTLLIPTHPTLVESW